VADNAPLDMSGSVVDTKANYSAVHPIGDDLYWSHAVAFYEGEWTIGGQTAPVGVKVVAERILNEYFEGTLEGTQKLDLREFGYGKCTGPFEAVMTMGAGEYPMEISGTALCTSGAAIEVEYAGAYRADGHYQIDILSGTLSLPH
jgi:hypothetical protein